LFLKFLTDTFSNTAMMWIKISLTVNKFTVRSFFSCDWGSCDFCF
jgi:hypothetical protein